MTLLDLGTGSGAIAVSLAKELENATILASDISEEALNYAKRNTQKHKVENRLRFFQGDLFEPFKNESLQMDLIVTNPPYVDFKAYDSLPPEVRDYEPHLALDGRENGFFFIEKIIREATDYMYPDGWLLIEMAPDQIQTSLEMLRAYGRYKDIKCIKDYSRKDRVVMARKL